MDGRALNRKVWRDLLNLEQLEFSALRGAASESALGGRVLWTRGSRRGRSIFPQGGWADLSGSSCETKHMRMAVGRGAVEEVVVVVVAVVVVVIVVVVMVVVVVVVELLAMEAGRWRGKKWTAMSRVMRTV